MPLTTFFRFRLWQLFALVAIFSLGLWLITQVGVETAEIEVLQFDVWDGKDSDEPATVEVAKVKFEYLLPESRIDTCLVLFVKESALTSVKNIVPGTRIRFRYRSSPMMWLKPVQPDPLAIRLIGLNPDDIEEIITEVNLPVAIR